MRKNKKLKNIAFLLASSSEISEEIMTVIKKHLTKSELKTLARLYRLEVQKRTVQITTSLPLTTLQKGSLEKNYSPLIVNFEVDENLGGGMRIMKQDTVIDMSVKHYIIQMVQNLSAV